MLQISTDLLQLKSLICWTPIALVPFLFDRRSRSKYTFQLSAMEKNTWKNKHGALTAGKFKDYSEEKTSEVDYGTDCHCWAGNTSNGYSKRQWNFFSFLFLNVFLFQLIFKQKSTWRYHANQIFKRWNPDPSPSIWIIHRKPPIVFFTARLPTKTTQRKRFEFATRKPPERAWKLTDGFLDQVEGLYQSWCSKGKPSSKQDCRFNITIQVRSGAQWWWELLMAGKIRGGKFWISLGTSKMLSYHHQSTLLGTITYPQGTFESMIFLFPFGGI